MDGLLRDKTRPSRIPPLGPEVAQRVVALTTTTLFAALNVLDGTVIGRCMQRHHHQELIRLLNGIEVAVPIGRIVHVILDNYGAHKHAKVRAWLDRHPRFVFHYSPTSASWLNAVEGFFAKLTKRRLKRGVFRSLAEANENPKPFVCTARGRDDLVK